MMLKPIFLKVEQLVPKTFIFLVGTGTYKTVILPVVLYGCET